MKKQNFTLIELLVVVAIIGILISLLMPSLSKAREAAKAAVCVSNLSQISKALQMYIDDNSGFYPKKKTNSGKFGWLGKQGTGVNNDALSIHNRALNVYLGGPYEDDGEIKVAHCPSDDKRYETKGSSYKINLETFSWDKSLVESGNDCINVALIQSPVKMVIMAEWGAIPTVKGNSGQVDNFHSKLWGSAKQNTLFADGHVKSVSFYEGLINSSNYVFERDSD